MIKYTFGEIFSSGGATLYKNPSDQTVKNDMFFFAKLFTEKRVFFEELGISEILNLINELIYG